MQQVRISSNILQKINMTGQEVFGTTITQSGSLDAGHSVGDVVSNQQTIYDAEGNQFTLNIDYTKTAANTYSLSYDVIDSGNASIFSTPPASKTVVFDSTTGVIKSVDGKSSFSFNVTDSTSKIIFSINLNELTEMVCKPSGMIIFVSLSTV